MLTVTNRKTQYCKSRLSPEPRCAPRGGIFHLEPGWDFGMA